METLDTSVISISVVSHGHGNMVSEVLADLARLSDLARFEVILTKNIPERLSFSVEDFPYPVKVVENAVPKGFGANHNAAFRLAGGEWFCVLNPDVRLTQDPFEKLLECLRRTGAALVGPLVVDANGGVEDSARRFPTPLRIAKKLIRRMQDLDYKLVDQPLSPDWLAGMFLFFPSGVFRGLGGFDERYFLYYEDVDLCARLRLEGHDIAFCPQARVVHVARRESHRNLRYLRWHAASMMRFFSSAVFTRLAIQGLLGQRRTS